MTWSYGAKKCFFVMLPLVFFEYFASFMQYEYLAFEICVFIV